MAFQLSLSSQIKQFLSRFFVIYFLYHPFLVKETAMSYRPLKVCSLPLSGIGSFRRWEKIRVLKLNPNEGNVVCLLLIPPMGVEGFYEMVFLLAHGQ